jgi:hypothetical protein
MTSQSFEVFMTEQADDDLKALELNSSLSKRFKAVNKALAYLQSNPKHPSLNTHKYSSLAGPNGEEIFEAYAENKTPAAYRIFWYYGPLKKQITVLTITKHP